MPLLERCRSAFPVGNHHTHLESKKGKNSLTIACYWFLLIHKGYQPQTENLSAYRLMHPTYDVIVIYPSGPSPRVHFEQFKQRQETANLATWAYGNLTQQRHCQIHFRSTSVLFFSNSCYPGSSCPPGIIMLFSDKSMGALTADQDLLMAVTLYCSLEMPEACSLVLG